MKYHDVLRVLEKELDRQKNTINLIASENCASPGVPNLINPDIIKKDAIVIDADVTTVNEDIKEMGILK